MRKTIKRIRAVLRLIPAIWRWAEDGVVVAPKREVIRLLWMQYPQATGSGSLFTCSGCGEIFGKTPRHRSHCMANWVLDEIAHLTPAAAEPSR